MSGSFPSDLQQNAGPKVGEQLFINNMEDVTVSDISQGMVTTIGLAIDDQVHLGQVQVFGLDHLNVDQERGRDYAGNSDDTIDPDEDDELPSMKPSQLSRKSTLSSLTDDVDRVYNQNGQFLISRMINPTTVKDSSSIDESSFDERYTLNHPPLALEPSSPESVNWAGWPSMASTRTPPEDKIAIDIQSPGKVHRSIVSLGYLHDFTRPLDYSNVGTLAATTLPSGSNSKCSVGFVTYAYNKYAQSSVRKKVAVLSSVGVILLLIIVSCIMGFDRYNSDPVVHELPQPDEDTETLNSAIGNETLAIAASDLADMEQGIFSGIPTGHSVGTNIESDVRNESVQVLGNETHVSTTIPTSSGYSISPNVEGFNQGDFSSWPQLTPTSQPTSLGSHSRSPSQQSVANIPTDAPTPVPTRPTAPFKSTPLPTPRKRQSIKPSASISWTSNTPKPSPKQPPTNKDPKPNSKPNSKPRSPKPTPHDGLVGSLGPSNQSEQPSPSSVPHLSASPVSTVLPTLSLVPTNHPSRASALPASSRPTSLAPISPEPYSSTTTQPSTLTPEPSRLTPRPSECSARNFSFDNDRQKCTNEDGGGKFDTLKDCCVNHFGSIDNCNFVDICGIYTHRPTEPPTHLPTSHKPTETPTKEPLPPSPEPTPEPTPEPIEEPLVTPSPHT